MQVSAATKKPARFIVRSGCYSEVEARTNSSSGCIIALTNIPHNEFQSLTYQGAGLSDADGGGVGAATVGGGGGVFGGVVGSAAGGGGGGGGKPRTLGPGGGAGGIPAASAAALSYAVAPLSR